MMQRKNSVILLSSFRNQSLLVNGNTPSDVSSPIPLQKSKAVPFTQEPPLRGPEGNVHTWTLVLRSL